MLLTEAFLQLKIHQNALILWPGLWSPFGEITTLPRHPGKQITSHFTIPDASTRCRVTDNN